MGRKGKASYGTNRGGCRHHIFRGHDASAVAIAATDGNRKADYRPDSRDRVNTKDQIPRGFTSAGVRLVGASGSLYRTKRGGTAPRGSPPSRHGMIVVRLPRPHRRLRDRRTNVENRGQRSARAARCRASARWPLERGAALGGQAVAGHCLSATALFGPGLRLRPAHGAGPLDAGPQGCGGRGPLG